jgi:hypothetical protein
MLIRKRIEGLWPEHGSVVPGGAGIIIPGGEGGGEGGGGSPNQTPLS